jgi:hypothetical protein
MDTAATLSDNADAIVAEATEALARTHLEHYEEAGPQQRQRRLQTLFDVTVECLRQRDLAPIIGHAEGIANDRFDAGFALVEVQTAFNVLEEAIWRTVVTEVPLEDLAEAVGLVTTVLGAGKDAAARAYVSLATRRHVPSLDMSALFRGL